jgi:hypothetical protein
MYKTHQFALHFIDDDVHLLTRNCDSSAWDALHVVSLDSQNLTTKMVALCEYVKHENNGNPYVSVLLPDEDIQHSAVSVSGRHAKARDQHVRRTLARRHAEKAYNIVAQYGNVDAQKIAPVCFALTTTLIAAEKFVCDFGFRVTYFSSLSDNELSEDVCLMLPHQERYKKIMRRIPVVRASFKSAVAAIVCIGLFASLGIPRGDDELMANIRDGGSVADWPVVLTAGYQVQKGPQALPVLAQTIVLDQPWQAANSMAISFSQMPAQTRAYVSTLTMAQLDANRIVPNQIAARKNDVLANILNGNAPDTAFEPSLLMAAYLVPKSLNELPALMNVGLLDLSVSQPELTSLGQAQTEPSTTTMAQLAAKRIMPSFLVAGYKVPAAPETLPAFANLAGLSQTWASSRSTILVDTVPVQPQKGVPAIVVAQLSAERVVPSQAAASEFDAIVNYNGGFFVFVGQQANLTQKFADSDQDAIAGQVVFINKTVQPLQQMARTFNPLNGLNTAPYRYVLSEFELASFSRP